VIHGKAHDTRRRSAHREPAPLSSGRTPPPAQPPEWVCTPALPFLNRLHIGMRVRLVLVTEKSGDILHLNGMKCTYLDKSLCVRFLGNPPTGIRRWLWGGDHLRISPKLQPWNIAINGMPFFSTHLLKGVVQNIVTVQINTKWWPPPPEKVHQTPYIEVGWGGFVDGDGGDGGVDPPGKELIGESGRSGYRTGGSGGRGGRRGPGARVSL